MELLDSLAGVVGKYHGVWRLVADSASMITIRSSESGHKSVNRAFVSTNSSVGEDSNTPGNKLIWVALKKPLTSQVPSTSGAWLLGFVSKLNARGGEEASVSPSHVGIDLETEGVCDWIPSPV